MRVAVLVVLAACAFAQNEPHAKPYEPTEAPDKQVEYVTGPNVGIVGPTVLGGKGQEVQPSGEELQSTDKEQRDVSSQSAVYSGYQELPTEQDESKGQAEAAYAKYAASLNYSGVKYQEPQTQHRKPQKKHQVVKIGSRPTTKVAYFQTEEPARYTQSQDQYYQAQNQETGKHQPSGRRPQEYQQVQTQQVDSRGSENQGKSSASQESQPQEEEAQKTPPTDEAPVYIPQEYLQYQLAPEQAQLGELQSAAKFPGKHQLQLFLPQDATGHINGHEPIQVTAVQSPHLQPVQNGHQIQYIPTYITTQPATLHKESHQPAVQVIRQQPGKHEPTFALHSAYSSSPTNPSINPRAQPHPQLHPSILHSSQLQQHSAQLQVPQPQSPQLHSNFQPSLHPVGNDQTQYHLLHQFGEALRRPQNVYIQQKQSPAPTTQLASQKSPSTKPTNYYFQPQSQPTVYRQNSPERLPQRQPEHLALVSPSPPKMTQHRQTHDPPPTHQPEQIYESESTQTTDDKPSPPIHSRPYVQKVQTALHIQNPTPFPVKAMPIQPQIHIPLSQYELSSDKVALRPLLYPIPTPGAQQTEIPYHGIPLIPTEDAKLYNIKIPNYIKALQHQTGESKPFGFSQMSFGEKPGSYSYSIFNKHS